MSTYRLHQHVDSQDGQVRLGLLVGRRDRVEPIVLDRQRAWDLALSMLATLNATEPTP